MGEDVVKQNNCLGFVILFLMASELFFLSLTQLSPVHVLSIDFLFASLCPSA